MANSYNKERLGGSYTSGSVKSTDVAVSGTRTLLPPYPLAGRKEFLLVNNSSATIYVGGFDVSRYNGIPLVSGTVFSLPAGGSELYAVTPNSVTVSGIRILEVS